MLNFWSILSLFTRGWWLSSSIISLVLLAQTRLISLNLFSLGNILLKFWAFMWSQRTHMSFLDSFTSFIYIWDHWIVNLITLAKKSLSIRSIVTSNHLLLGRALQSNSIGPCNCVELLLIWNLVSTQLIVLRVLLLSSLKIVLVNLLLVIPLSAI